MVTKPTNLCNLNVANQPAFVAVAGPAFEKSPWVAERAWPRRPFASIAALHDALCETVRTAGHEAQIALIRAHPDLVGRAARAGTLTPESSDEQASAGLDALSAETIAQFDAYNAAYREKFGFPFVICARENKCATILAAFPRRLANSREREIATALQEIFKIAWLRLSDAVSE